MAFNPIKETVDGKKAHDMIWSSKVIEIALKGLEQGKKLIANPFYENNTKLLKGDLVFERTPEEVDEWVRCREDIIYFANKYCKLMTPEGIKNVEMRDYQKDYLRHLEKNRLSIFLSCRQSGKCNLFIINLLCKFKQNFWDQFDYTLKKYFNRNYYIGNDIYRIPFFEVYNLYDRSFKWKIEYHLYKVLYKLICLKERRHQRTLGKESSTGSKEIQTKQ